MPDIRRNILWGVFLVSLFLLWDAWNKHNGQPSFFAPPAARPQAAARSSYQAPRTTARAIPQVSGNTALAQDNWEEF